MLLLFMSTQILCRLCHHQIVLSDLSVENPPFSVKELLIAKLLALMALAVQEYAFLIMLAWLIIFKR